MEIRCACSICHLYQNIIGYNLTYPEFLRVLITLDVLYFVCVCVYVCVLPKMNYFLVLSLTVQLASACRSYPFLLFKKTFL